MVKLLAARDCSYSSLPKLCWLICYARPLSHSLHLSISVSKLEKAKRFYIRMTHVSNDPNALFATFVDILLHSAFHRRMEINYCANDFVLPNHSQWTLYKNVEQRQINLRTLDVFVVCSVEKSGLYRLKKSGNEIQNRSFNLLLSVEIEGK